jgi:hypothetical protein
MGKSCQHFLATADAMEKGQKKSILNKFSSSIKFNAG